MVHRRTRPFCLGLLAFLSACGMAPPGDVSSSTASATTAPAASGATLVAAASAPLPSDAPFTDGEHAFAAVKEGLLKTYGGSKVSEDELYRAATQGMLEHIDAKRTAWNKLLSPEEVRALSSDLRGEVVGIGAEIHFETATGYTEVLGVLPGSPAEAAGLRQGDTILDVDGKLFKGETQKDVLAEIRGKAGERVTLNVLRDGKLVTIAVVRQIVSYGVVQDAMLPEGVGYMRIRSFNAKTAPAVTVALAALATGGARSMIVDLRGNPGGGFDDAIATANELLPAGAGIVTVVKKGVPDETIVAKTGATKLATVPMAVLIDGETASGGEFLTAALHTGRKADVVGERSFGKWSLQTIEDLPNGYAAKYTLGVLRTPAGESYDGVGLSPDVEVHLDHAAYIEAQRTTDWTRRAAVDAPLRTAMHLLRPR